MSIMARLRHWLSRRPDAHMRYLYAASDLADLERRQRAYERHEQRSAGHWLALQAFRSADPPLP